MSDITIEGTQYKKEEMNDEEIALVGKLAQIQQNKNGHYSQIADLDILETAYLEKLKESLKKPKEEK